MAGTFTLARLRVSTLLLILALPFACGCATPPPPADHADGRWLQVEVVDRDSGRALRVWRDHGDAVVAGTPGARYAVRLLNRCGERLLAVVSVDGINIITGETAGVKQRGYVLSPWGSASLSGWRKSSSQVAAFEFTALADSYAARTGRPGDVGVIGVAVFRERRVQGLALSAAAPPVARDGPSPPAAPAPGESAATKDNAEPSGQPEQASPAGEAERSAREARIEPGERLGTGHGPRETSYATTVRFDRATSAPEEILRIRYDSLDNLVAAGIVPRALASVAPGTPRPFPVDEGFVPDPPAR